MNKETILKFISDEADKLERTYVKENEIHEGYYILGLRRFEGNLKKRFMTKVWTEEQLRKAKAKTKKAIEENTKWRRQYNKEHPNSWRDGLTPESIKELEKIMKV